MSMIFIFWNYKTKVTGSDRASLVTVAVEWTFTQEKQQKLDIVVNHCNLSTQEAEAGGKPGLHKQDTVWKRNKHMRNNSVEYQ
jgi:hypothetical protein